MEKRTGNRTYPEMKWDIDISVFIQKYGYKYSPKYSMKLFDGRDIE